jgi:hypothetical protein
MSRYVYATIDPSSTFVPCLSLANDSSGKSYPHSQLLLLRKSPPPRMPSVKEKKSAKCKTPHSPQKSPAQRNPLLPFLAVGLFQNRLVTRQLSPSLPHEPPRRTRYVRIEGPFGLVAGLTA